MRSYPVTRMVGDQVSDKGRSAAGENDRSAEQMRLALAGFIAQRSRAEVRRYRQRAQRRIETALQPARSAVRRVVWRWRPAWVSILAGRYAWIGRRQSYLFV